MMDRRRCAVGLWRVIVLSILAGPSLAWAHFVWVEADATAPAVPWRCFDGKFVVRGGQTETLEGDWKPNRIVVLEFPSMDKARAWYHSPDYTAAKKIRQQASKGKMILVEGI